MSDEFVEFRYRGIGFIQDGRHKGNPVTEKVDRRRDIKIENAGYEQLKPYVEILYRREKLPDVRPANPGVGEPNTDPQLVPPLDSPQPAAEKEPS